MIRIHLEPERAAGCCWAAAALPGLTLRVLPPSRLKSRTVSADLTEVHLGECLMNNELLDTIRTANGEFEEFIDQVSQNGAKVVETRGAMRRLGKVDLRLRHVSKCLAAVSQSSAEAPEDAHQVLKYRENLKVMKVIMETLQTSLLAEKARLDNVRANTRAACAWAASVREYL
jgi:hypothetical protein